MIWGLTLAWWRLTDVTTPEGDLDLNWHDHTGHGPWPYQTWTSPLLPRRGCGTWHESSTDGASKCSLGSWVSCVSLYPWVGSQALEALSVEKSGFSAVPHLLHWRLLKILCLSQKQASKSFEEAWSVQECSENPTPSTDAISKAWDSELHGCPYSYL